MKTTLSSKINKIYRNLDFVLIIAVIILCLFSLANIYSATHSVSHSHYLLQQILWLIASVIVVCLILHFNYTRIVNNATILYWISILLLLYTDIGGYSVNGARAWIKIGSFLLEPGEFAKLALTLILAKKIKEMEGEINKPKNILILLFYILIPILLIIKQPDLGIASICFVMALCVIFIGGINLKTFSIGLALIMITIPLVWNTNLIKPYQKSRFMSFLNQNNNTSGNGYQLEQSKIAIGSGGILGKGYLKGSGNAIPESSTDFIYAVVGEEEGFAGGLFLLILYGIILVRIFLISKKSKNIEGTLICAGIGIGFMFSIMVNMGMTIGIMPITGITLPFFSYGGSSLISNAIGIGLILNVRVSKGYMF